MLRSHDKNGFIVYTQKTTLRFETVKFSDTDSSEWEFEDGEWNTSYTINKQEYNLVIISG